MYTLDWHRGFFRLCPVATRWGLRITTCNTRLTYWVLDWHPVFSRLCPVAIRRSERIETCKKLTGILGFFGSAQWPSDYMYVPEHVNTRLTSWVFRFRPVAFRLSWYGGTWEGRNESQGSAKVGAKKKKRKREDSFHFINFSSVLPWCYSISQSLPLCYLSVSNAYPNAPPTIPTVAPYKRFCSFLPWFYFCASTCFYSIVVTHPNCSFSIAFPLFHACFTR